jgi:hypothetical protein
MTVEERLECLERRANRYRNALVLLVMSVCAVALIGATADDGIIRAKGLVITNDEGLSVIIAARTENGEGLLMVKSKTGKDLIYAGATVEGNGLLTVSSKTGQDLIYAGSTVEGNGLLTVSSKTGQDLIYANDGIIRAKGLVITNDEGLSVIRAAVTDNGNGLLTVKSKTGQDLIQAGSADGDGVLTVKSKTGQDLINAGASSTGDGFMFEGYNKTGEVVVQLKADDYGNGLVGAYNRKGMGRELKPRD